MIKAIFFDLCGVIITLGDREFSQELSKQFNIDSKRILDTFYQFLEENETGKISEEKFYQKMFQALEVSFDIEEIKKIRTSLRIEIDGMRDLINKLTKNYLVGYISNDAQEIAARCNKKFNLDKLFHIGIQAYQVRVRKDSPKLFLTLLKKVNLQPEECVFTDDKAKNLHAAKKLGLKTIVFKSKKQFIKEIKKLGVNI